MADQWYFSENGQRKGPVSEDDLKRLACSGQLKPADLVWKKGMASWGPASNVEGLAFASPAVSAPPAPLETPAPSADEPPPVPPEDVSPAAPRGTLLKTSLLNMAASLAHRGKNAVQLVKKYAERFGLKGWTLTRAYWGLGKHLHSQDAYRTEFPAIYIRLDGLLAEIALLEQMLPTEQRATEFKAKSRAVLRSAQHFPESLILRRRAKLALVELGKAAYEKHGEQSGLEAAQPVKNALTRVENLGKEIADLAQAQPGQVITAQRIVAAAGVLLVLLLLLLGKWMLFGAKSEQSRGVDVEAASGTDGRRQTPAQNATSAEGNPPYAHLKGRVQELVRKKLAQKSTKAEGASDSKGEGGLRDTHNYELRQEVFGEIKDEINAFYAAIPPLPCTIDSSCQDAISDASASAPEAWFLMTFDEAFRFKVRVKFTTKVRMDKRQEELVGMVCDRNGAIMCKEPISLDADASPGEIVSAHFQFDDSVDILSKACSFRIGKKVEKPHN